MAKRRVSEILRYRFEDGLGHKAISYRVGAAPSTVRETLRLAGTAGLADWTIERIGREASAIGPDAALLCQKILADRPHPEQWFRT
ncbi:MAG: hypothetical protein EPN45_03965 [Rhizobiaceae bacterium]|nr:MAG: hypothetical protein EPN45_03965 [Rhizobiaceae bacterium]